MVADKHGSTESLSAVSRLRIRSRDFAVVGSSAVRSTSSQIYPITRFIGLGSTPVVTLATAPLSPLTFRNPFA